mgnify:CR=1 FL=1
MGIKYLKKYKKNYPQEHEEIIKTEIPPSNWGLGYWEILKKITEENEKQGKNLLQENLLK